MRALTLMATDIKKRDKANDIFITPLSLVNNHIDLIQHHIHDNIILYDPFFGTGNYYNSLKERFPNNLIKFTEINMGTDFFEFNEKIDCIVSNPPYSLIDKVFQKSCDLQPNIISYLIGYLNFTPKRIEYMNSRGYFIENIHLCKVYKWFGISSIITFSNLINDNCITFDRQVHR